MKLFERAWDVLISLLGFLSLSPVEDHHLQKPLNVGGISNEPATFVHHTPSFPPSSPAEIISDEHVPVDTTQNYPIFKPPGSPPDSDFTCQYPGLIGWSKCNSPSFPWCWVQTPDGNGRFDLFTDYEAYKPPGVTRRYYLDAANVDGYLAPDGFKNTEAKLFNKQYPGPWLQACWGDTIEIVVTNRLRCNGTTIHWHGVRQKGTMNEDGVNAVSQCPIAGLPTPDSHTYRFEVWQYGTSWYHSHYSLQYADGLLGPLTFYGPSSSYYDEAKEPFLMTDWSHRSAFQLFYQEIINGPPVMTSMLLNGRGNFSSCDSDPSIKQNCTTIPSPYTTFFTYSRRYLLRLINTSVESGFIFSIDNHTMTVIETDFVPIKPYQTNNVHVAIGQRYDVVVQADQQSQSGTFWMRQYAICGATLWNATGDASAIGIVQYGNGPVQRPTTNPWPFDKVTCQDEPYELLQPVVNWTVGVQANAPITAPNNSQFDVGFGQAFFPDKFTRWEIAYDPMYLDFGKPTILNLTWPGKWDPWWNVIPQNYSSSSWVYLLITSPVAAHPIHLHGHDFAVLQVSNVSWSPSAYKPKFDNPPRRDVVLLPNKGFIVLAFRPDNPGAWLIHCHIAWHASSGLAMQILERAEDAAKLYGPGSPSYAESKRLCANWEKWYGNRTNWDNEACNYEDPNIQDDSGI